MGYDRTKRAAMAEQLQTEDPEAYAELLELRRYNPQGYRKRLKRLLRQGIVRPPPTDTSPVTPTVPTPDPSKPTKKPRKKSASSAPKERHSESGSTTTTASRAKKTKK